MGILERVRSRLSSAFSAVDAVDAVNKRRQPSGRLRSRDREIDARKRRSLISGARELQTNFAVAGWAIRKHLDFVSSFSFQSTTGDKGLDAEIESLVNWWSRPQNCDVAGRHSLPAMVRLLEASRTVDGDVFVIKLRDGRLQAIEGDRVRSPNRELLNGNADRVVQGIEVDDAGRARRFAIHRRNNLGFDFERWVGQSRCIHFGYFDRIDQVRGLSPLMPAMNAFSDLYENFDYALAKSKISQLFGVVFYRDAVDSIGPLSDAPEETDDGSPYDDVQLGTRPLVLDLQPGDRAEFLNTSSATSDFQSFTQSMLSIAIKSLDIPYSMFDESHTNFYGSRASLQLYLKSAEAKRRSVVELLRQITTWRIGLWVRNGVLTLPSGMDLTDLRWEWVSAGMPWWDPSKEIRADVMAIDSGLRSRREIRKERYGDDWFDVIDRLAEEEQYIEQSGIKITAPAGHVFNPDDQTEDSNET